MMCTVRGGDDNSRGVLFLELRDIVNDIDALFVRVEEHNRSVTI